MYNHEKRVFLIQKFYELKNTTLVQRAFRTKYVCSHAPMSLTIMNMVRAFENTGHTSRHPTRIKTKRVRTEELVESLKNLNLKDPNISLRKVANLVPASHETVRKVYREDLNIKPFKKIKTFLLKKVDHSKRQNFAKFILSNINARSTILDWFICSDEAYFYLHGGHNIQNDRIWAQFQPYELVEKPLNDDKVMVWCAFSATKVYGPYFFKNTVNWQNYLQMLKDFFWKQHSRVKHFQYYYFQQDGAPPHRKKEVQTWLKEKFGDRFLDANMWPPRSPDLNPCDFSLWGQMKHRVYNPKPENIDQLRENIEREFRNFKKTDLKACFLNLKKRCDLLIQENGRHIEHLL